MAQQSIKPLFSYVLIRPAKQDDKTSSGIYLPETAKEKPQMGEVMEVGTGGCCDSCTCEDKKSCGMVVKKKQKVIYKKWGGNEIKVGNEEWLLVEQKDIMAIVN